MTPREWMLAVLAGTLLIGVLMLWRAQKSKTVQFDAFDLIMENGKVSKIALAFIVSFAVTTWVLVYTAIQGKSVDALFGLYGTMWVAPLVVKVIFNKNEMPGTISTTTVTQQTTEILEPSGVKNDK